MATGRSSSGVLLFLTKLGRETIAETPPPRLSEKTLKTAMPQKSIKAKRSFEFVYPGTSPHLARKTTQKTKV